MVLAKAGANTQANRTFSVPAFTNAFPLGATGTPNSSKIRTLWSYTDHMSKEEINQEITKELDQFSEMALMNFLSFLKQFPSKQTQSIFSGDHLERLLIEDKELLERLAQ
jgi:hypothetical protein